MPLGVTERDPAGAAAPALLRRIGDGGAVVELRRESDSTGMPGQRILFYRRRHVWATR